MIVTKLQKMDLLSPPVQDTVHAVQCDANTRAVAVTLTAGGVAWEPPANTAISVAFKKPDGKKGWYDKLPDGSSACSVSGNVVTAILAPEVLTAAGKVDAVIVFQDKNLNQLATFGFAILVGPNPAAGRGISNDYYAYSTMKDVSDAVEAMLDSLEDTKADIGQLIQQVSEAVSLAEQEAGPAIVCQASGDVIAVADSSDRPVQGLKLFGKTVQNGTPSPNAPVPLESAGAGGSIGLTVAGKNLWNNAEINLHAGISIMTLTATGFKFTRGEHTTGAMVSFITPIYEGQTVTFSAKGSARVPYLHLYKDKAYGTVLKNLRGPLTYTATEDMPNATFAIVINSDEDDCEVSDIQIEFGTEVTAYQPYKAVQTLTVSTPNGLPGVPVTSGGNYTDANGQQWICDEVDFARGVYVQRVETRELRSNSWRMDGTLDANNWKFGLNVGTQVIRGAIASDHFRHMSSVAVGHAQGNGIYIWENGYMEVVSPNHTTAEAFRQWNWDNPIVIMYALATPTETPLDADTLATYAALHSNKPNTTVYNDAGAHMELSYVADTKLYIDQKLAAISAAVLNK